MRITEFTIQNDDVSGIRKVISEDRHVHILHSAENSTGKTALLRAILHTLGFGVPNLDRVKFENYEFRMKIAYTNGTEKTHEICRKGKTMIIDGIEFSLPEDGYVVRGLIFGASNKDMADNLLGAIYFDQDNGWTNFNRGAVIGGNSFDIDRFVLGLNNQYDESAERIEAELKSVDDRIKQYSQVVKVAKYQEGLAKDEDAGSASSSEFDSLESELLELKIRLSSVTRELNEVNSVISMSKGFIDYVKRKKIYIKLDKSQDDLMLMDDDGEPEEDAAKGIICVNESNLFYYSDQLLVDEARQSVLKAEMDELRRNIARIEARRAELLSAGGASAVDRQIRRIFNQMPVSLDEAQKKLDDLKAEKKKLRDSLSAEIAQGSDWLGEIKKWYKIYSEKLEIPKTSELDIMTRRTGGSSGTILYKLVVASKLACAKALSEKLGYPVPIFCDSPRGREVTDDKVKTVMELLRDEFAEHQIFIATIGEYGEIFPDANEITMNRTMFDLRE